MRGRVLGGLYAAGVLVSYYAKRITAEYELDVARRIETFQRNMWKVEEKLREKFISKFGSDGLLKILYDDGREIIVEKDVYPISRLPSNLDWEFMEKWTNGGLHHLDDLKAADVFYISPDSSHNLTMRGSELMRIFEDVVPYARGFKLKVMRDEQFLYESASLVETFLLVAFIMLSAYNLYKCIPAMKEDFGKLKKRMYGTRFTIRT